MAGDSKGGSVKAEVVVKTKAAFLCCSFAICCFGQDEKKARLPDHVKLVPGFVQFKPHPPTVTPAPPPSTACAHMVIFPVPQSRDSKMIMRIPEQSRSRMPIHKGLPPCDKDARR
jgi:hypothetical protein